MNAKRIAFLVAAFLLTALSPALAPAQTNANAALPDSPDARLKSDRAAWPTISATC